MEKYPLTADYMGDVLRRGRAVDVCVDTNSQGYLGSDGDMSKSISANFNTAYHLGGSEHSASRVLGITVKQYNELLKKEDLAAGQLGKGIAIVRNAITTPTQVARLPYAENEYARYFLGDASDWIPPQLREGNSAPDGSEEEARKTAQEADGAGNIGAFPVSDETNTPAHIDTSIVSAETREVIKNLYKKGHGMPLREIAPKLKLGGRKYTLFMAVCREIGIDPEQQAKG